MRPGRNAEIASLTGLRGLAALLVIVSHYWVWTRVTPTAELPVWMEPWTSTAALYGEMPTFNLIAVAYHAAHFLTALALAVMLATGIYRLVEVPGRRVIRAAADRLLGIASPARVARQQPEPAE